MNVAFFLTPKSEVVCLPAKATMRQALEKMEIYRYGAIPLVDEEGRYAGTLTEGDLLWRLKHSVRPSWLEEAEHTRIADIARRLDNKAVHIAAEMDDLIKLAIDQNFVPVVDDREVFVGIVRRSSIIEYCVSHMVVAGG